MANAFGGFVHRSPLSSVSSHSAMEDVMSNCVRDFFGPTCQTVADCLVSRGPGTLIEIIERVRTICKRDISEERQRLVEQQNLKCNQARGSEQDGYMEDANQSIRAALIVLLHHGIVHAQPTKRATTTKNKNYNKKVDVVVYVYKMDKDRARFTVRYPRYIEYAKKVVDENAAVLVEELLVHGRLRTEDAIESAIQSIQRNLKDNDNDDDDDDDDDDDTKTVPKLDTSEQAHLLESVVKSFKRLIDGGYVEMVEPIQPPDTPPTTTTTINKRTHDQISMMEPISSSSMTNTNNNGDDEKKEEAEDHPSHKIKADPQNENNINNNDTSGWDGASIVALLRNTHSYRRTFTKGAVWRVNVNMFHHTIRAWCLGRLVSERYGDKVQFAGTFVTAALKVAAFKEHAPTHKFVQTEEERQRLQEEKGIFSPDDLLDYLPPKILHELKNKAGGARSNISSALVALSSFGWPQVLMEVEEARGHPLGGKFEIATRQLVSHLRGRALNQIITSDQGQHAARVCAILETRGYLESEALADAAMVPIQDAREIVHRLYRSKYITLLNLQQTKQHNPGTAIYLWGVNKAEMTKAITHKIYTALYNLRLRRQHEVQVGKEWIERAKEAEVTDENDHQQDKLNYEKFCQGLERIDNALLQIDETLMLLADF